MAKEPATLIIFRSTRTRCSKKARLEAGCKVYHLNKYEMGHVVGGILTKTRYPIKILHDNLIKLTVPDQKVVKYYWNKKNKDRYYAHLKEKMHWLKYDKTFKIDDKLGKLETRKYLDKDHEIVKKFKERVYNVKHNYEKKYNVTYVLLPLKWRYILLFQAEVKLFEFRFAFDSTTKRDVKHFIATIDGMKKESKPVSKKKSKHSKLSKKQNKKKPAQKVIEYCEKITKNIHSFIEEKYKEDKNYNPLRDGQVASFIDHLGQYGIKKFDVLSAKPLKLDIKNFTKYSKNNTLHQKSWEHLKEDYNPGTAAAIS